MQIHEIVLWLTQSSFETQIWVATCTLRNTGLHAVFERILYRKQPMKSKEKSIMACNMASLVLLALAKIYILYNQTLRPIKFIKQRTHEENWSIYYFICYWFMDPYHYSWLAYGVSVNSTVNNCVISVSLVPCNFFLLLRWNNN
jgi:hypothetical protein